MNMQQAHTTVVMNVYKLVSLWNHHHHQYYYYNINHCQYDVKEDQTVMPICEVHGSNCSQDPLHLDVILKHLSKCHYTTLNLMYLWPCIICENYERYQLDATIVIYYHKYPYKFRASICPFSGVQVVCYNIWCSALGVVAVVLRSRCVVLCSVGFKLTHSAQDYTPASQDHSHST